MKKSTNVLQRKTVHSFLICLILILSMVIPISSMFATQNMVGAEESAPLTIPKPSVGVGDTFGLYPGALPCVGSPRVVVFVVNFLDELSGSGPGNSVADVEKRFFADIDSTFPSLYYEDDSLRSFYYRASYGKLDITGTVIAHTTQYPKSVYTDVNQIINEVMDNAGTENALDWSQYDVNEDGYIDGVYIALNNNFNFPGYSFVGPYDYERSEKKISQIAIINSLQYPSISLDAHETCHLLGLGDIYEGVNLNPEGAGANVVMEGAGDLPGIMKCVFGWIEPTIIAEVGETVVSLSSMSDTAEFAIIYTRADPNSVDWFVVEYITNTNNNYVYNFGIDESNGLRIWRVKMYSQFFTEGMKFFVSSTDRYFVRSPYRYIETARPVGVRNFYFYSGDAFTPFTTPNSNYPQNIILAGNQAIPDELINSNVYLQDIQIQDGLASFKVTITQFEPSAPYSVVSDEAELRNTIDNAVGPIVIALDNDIILTRPLFIPVNKDITLTSIDDILFKLIGASDRDTIIVNGMLTLDGIIVTHKSGAIGRGVTVQTDGTLIMFSGEISGNTASIGGGVYNGWGTFKLFGGVISNNTIICNEWISVGGGGVYNSYGIFVMSGGKISNNTNSAIAGQGGGVYSDGTFTMTGGEITDNIVTNNNYSDGGGVYNGDGTFTMSGGVISNNTANRSGGGVYNRGTFTMSNGKITHNTRDGVNGYGMFSMSGGMISNNIGRGVSVDSFTMFGGVIANNPDGGVYAVSFVMYGGEISNNAASYGGGVYVGMGFFKMVDGVIANNTASYGGGVYTINSFEMSGGMIFNNTASWGGGVYVSGGNFNMTSNSLISGNIARDGGGVYVYNGVFNATGGTISYNTATNSGGGIWVTGSSADVQNLEKLFVSDGVVFSNNRASAAYNRASIHDTVYNSYIGSKVTWTAPFTQGYNNYDISYTSGTLYDTNSGSGSGGSGNSSGSGGGSGGGSNSPPIIVPSPTFPDDGGDAVVPTPGDKEDTLPWSFSTIAVVAVIVVVLVGIIGTLLQKRLKS